jgi:hypothetical protein
MTPITSKKCFYYFSSTITGSAFPGCSTQNPTGLIASGFPQSQFPPPEKI